MYALLLPSAQSFISAVEENVNVDVRQIGVPTGAPTPWRAGSPPCIAVVCGPYFFDACFADVFFFIRTLFWPSFLTRQAPIWRRVTLRQIGSPSVSYRRRWENRTTPCPDPN